MPEKEKLKKYLMEQKKMSGEDADKHLKKLEEDKDEEKKLSAEVDEHEKKLSSEAAVDPTKMSGEVDATKMAAEEEEKAKLAAEEEEKAKLAAEEAEKAKTLSTERTADPTRMSAALKGKLSQLTKSINGTSNKVQLAAKKSSISSRLSALRKEGKLSPAELRGISIDEIAKLEAPAIEVLFGTLSHLSKKLDLSFKGDANAETVSKVRDNFRLQRLEMETRLNMPSKREAAMKRLKELDAEESKAIQMAQGSSKEERLSHYETDYKRLCELLDTSKDKTAVKTELKRFMDVHLNRLNEREEEASDEKRMSALATDVQTLHNEYKELVSLVASEFGVKTEELE